MIGSSPRARASAKRSVSHPAMVRFRSFRALPQAMRCHAPGVSPKCAPRLAMRRASLATALRS
jgi:hypothetical protein